MTREAAPFLLGLVPTSRFLVLFSRSESSIESIPGIES